MFLPTRGSSWLQSSAVISLFEQQSKWVIL